MSSETRITQVEFIKFEILNQINSSLLVNENLNIHRMFLISVRRKETRGMHAHKKCSQWISVLRGSVTINLTDGFSTKSIKLKNNGDFLFIPPGIWSTQHYARRSQTLVLCDLQYSESDYIRTWKDFLIFKKKSG